VMPEGQVWCVSKLAWFIPSLSVHRSTAYIQTNFSLLFEKIKVGLWDHVAVSACPRLPLLGNGSVKFPVSLLGNSSVETLPQEWIRTQLLLDASFSMWPMSYQGK
jgi:hypothetical protein